MISPREWSQVVTALNHAVVANLDGHPAVRLLPALDILASHAEPGCGYHLVGGRLVIDTPGSQSTPAPAPPAPTPPEVSP